MFRRLRRRWRALRHREELELELDEELRFHLERETERNLARGMSQEAARRAALLTFGGVARFKQDCRDARGVRAIEEVVQDLRFGARILRKNPGLSLIAVVTLALGIGANTAVFSVVDAVLLRPLAHPEPDRLVRIQLFDPKAAEKESTLGDADFLALRERNRTFASVAVIAAGATRFSFTGGTTLLPIEGSRVSADFFEVLQARAARGRTFARGEDRPGSPPVAVVSHRFWQQRLGADPRALGRPISLNGESYTVVGIMPAGFQSALTPRAELWAALPFEPPNARPPYYLHCIGRLKPGVGPEQARADASAIASQLRVQYPNTSYAAFEIEPLKRSIVGESRRPLLVLFGAVLCVLLIASVNLANLLLARGTARERELAVRSALGASRWRIVRQLLTESLLLAALGAALGLLLAVWGVRFIPAVAPANTPRLQEVAVDASVLGFTLAIALLSGLVFGLAPALQLSRLDLYTAFKESGGSNQSPARHRLRGLLVIVEAALALMLLTGAGLMVRSFVKLQRVDPGFDPDHVVSMTVDALPARYPRDEQLGPLQQEILARIRSLPGVQSAALSMGLPPDRLVMTNPFTVEGRTPSPGDTLPLAEQLLISPDYFRTLAIGLRAGRAFTDADREGAPPVVIINDSMARRHFPGRDPIGRRLQTGDYTPDGQWLTVVGVVGDVKYVGLNSEASPTMYTPYLQSLWWRSMYLTVRTTGDPLAHVAAVRSQVWSIDRELPVSQVKTMRQRMSESVGRSRSYTVLLGIFGAAALLLAAIGIYGVMAFTVKTRTHEIGIRMALGARARDVVRLVVADGMKLALIGTAIGILASIALTRLLRSLLFGVSAIDPATFTATALVLVTVMLLACYVPARRATRVDPNDTLRYE